MSQYINVTQNYLNPYFKHIFFAYMIEQYFKSHYINIAQNHLKPDFKRINLTDKLLTN